MSVKKAPLVCLFWLFALAALSSLSDAQEVGFVERFALATDRNQVLRELVPGTQDYYYFHALHYQTIGQLEKVPKLLNQWVKRFGETERYKRIQIRQALLQFEDKPEQTWKYLERELDLDFNHQRELPTAQRNLPSRLDSKLIAHERLIRSALQRHGDTSGITDIGLEQLDAAKLERNRIRHLLSRLKWPDYPNLVELVAKDLKAKDSRGFGSLAIHGRLTLPQLEQLLQARPKLIENSRFVSGWLGRLRPSNDVNWQADPGQHQAYLLRLHEFVRRLSPSFNSLKACVIYRRLELDRKQGRFDRKLFVEYLKLPRNVGYINRKIITRDLESRDHLVNLSADFRGTTGLAAVDSDETLVREYLLHFLEKSGSWKPFAPYFRDEYLKKQFATAKILSGSGDPERWASMLNPEQYRKLQNRVDLDFLLTNSEFHDGEQPIEIELYTKNVEKLIVKIFEVNSFNFYRKYKREIDTDINLDGLVPTWEETFEYDSPPAVRVKRSFEFDQLEKPGVYVIDFIGGGKSSRALIRRGRLSIVGSPSAAGQQFRVFDRENQQVQDARLWVSGSEYRTDKDGAITLPFSNQPGEATAIASTGNLSSLQKFDRLAETYELTAGIYVDRETLLANRESSVLIRPSLRVAGVAAPIELLTDVQLAITSTDHSGISSTKRVDRIRLENEAEAAVKFLVPPRLHSIRFELTAKVENISRNEQQSLSVTRQLQINEIARSDEIQDLHLLPVPGGYYLEALGRTGERRASQPVRIRLKHRNVTHKISTDLQTDDSGRVALGTLTGFEFIEAELAGGSTRTWQLLGDSVSRSQKMNIVAGETIEIPAPVELEQLTTESVGLFELRSGIPVSNRFDSISLTEGVLRIRGLEPGDYELALKRTGHVVRIAVARGDLKGDVVLGQRRRLELRNVRPLTIANLESTEKKIEIQLRNNNSRTRVHVFATRYQPRFDSWAEMATVGEIEPWNQTVAVPRSAYLAGRTLGDEYQYILNRRFQRQFPGNMLPRPAILISPWTVRETENKVESLESGDDFGDVGTDIDGRKSRGGGVRNLQLPSNDFANLDFLDQRSKVIANLKPDENGKLTIDRDQLNGLHHIRVVALDADSTTQRSITLEPERLKRRDLRLADGLDPEDHFSQSKQIEVLAKGDTLTIDDLTSGQFQYFDEIGDVYRLFLTLNPNTRLVDFEFLLTWSEKSASEKQTLYSKHACHELNFYLYHKDRGFFNKVVQPHISFKHEQGLIDQFLIDGDIDTYDRSWQFQRLNVLERILLSRRLGDERSAQISGHINDLYLANPTPRESLDALYDQAMRADALFANEFYERKSATRNVNQLPKFAESELRESLGFEMVDQPKAMPSAGGVGGAGELDGSTEDRRDRGRVATIAQKQSPKREMLGSQAGRKFIAGGMVATPDDSGSDDELAVLEEFKLKSEQNLSELRDKTRSLYRRLSPTREWIEQQYYHVPLESQTVELIPVNRFWRDYARHEHGQFLSPYFAEAHRSLAEMMFALAVLDLPEQAPEHQTVYDEDRMTFTAGGPLVALHQQFQPVLFEPRNTTVLVAENFFQKDDRYQQIDGVQHDKFVTDRFVAHTLYGGQVVLTNPTSTPMSVDLLIQIPTGSVATAGSQPTRSSQVQLDAFSTQTFEYYFYFPTAGQFAHYPAHVSRKEQVLAVAENRGFEVVDRPRELDRESWAWVSQNGSEDQVIEFLQTKNVLQIDLAKIAFRLAERPFFERLIETLRARCTYNHLLWSYAIRHQDDAIASQFLDHEQLIAGRVGRSFQSKLLTVEPWSRSWYQHREYSPLINARVHQLGKTRTILNPAFHSQYHLLLDVLANRNELTDEDHLVVTYYMLLQDRIEEAIEHFGKVDRGNLQEQIQYDYCDAFLDFHLEDPDAAAEKAEKWADYPVDLWRDRFAAIIAQVDEIRGGQTDVSDRRDNLQQQTKLADQSTTFDFDIESNRIQLTSNNVDQLTVNFYEMDIELMFSRKPFAEKEVDGFSVVRPNLTKNVAVDSEKLEIEIPDQFRNSNVLVEVAAGDQVKSKPHFARSMELQTIERYGQVKVVTQQQQSPIGKAYVKVYSRGVDGTVRFHKDGYTDLRGRFDYVSQSNNPLDGIEQYSILVISPRHGALTRQVRPPAE